MALIVLKSDPQTLASPLSVQHLSHFRLIYFMCMNIHLYVYMFTVSLVLKEARSRCQISWN